MQQWVTMALFLGVITFVGAYLTDSQVMTAYCQTMAGTQFYQEYRLDLKCQTRVQVYERTVRFLCVYL
jgi:hypothetical protein